MTARSHTRTARRKKKRNALLHARHLQRAARRAKLLQPERNQ